MGHDFIYVKQNGYSLEKAYRKLFSGRWEVIESSDERYFNRIPQLKEIEEIEMGSSGTKKSILRLKDGGFVVINKTIKFK